MPPRLATYIYPWDMARLGVRAVLDDFESWQIEGVHLAANYHAISAVSPRGADLRVFFCPRGAVFFPARHERYGRIKPAVWQEDDVTSVWHEVASQAEARSLTLAAWTITMFQPWIAQDYPFAARVTANGDRSDSGICPNSVDVQDYLANLAVDLAEQFNVRGFVLEGNGIPPYDYGWIRPRLFTPLTPLAKELLRLCFCDSCKTLAKAQGLDPEAVRARVRALLRERGIASDVQPDHVGNLEPDDDLAEYANLGSVGAETVVRRMDEALRANRLRAGVIVPAPGTDVGGSGARLDHVADVVAGIRLFGAGALSDQQAFLDLLRRNSPGVVTEAMLHPPLVPGMPVITASFDYEDEHFLRDYADAMAAGLDWACVYHYGLLDPERFARTMALLGVERN